MSGVYIGVYTGSYSLTCMFTHTYRTGWVRVIDLKCWPCDSIDRGRPTRTHIQSRWFDSCRLPAALVLSSQFVTLLHPPQWTERAGSCTLADFSASTVSFALTSHNTLPEGRGEKLDECVCAVSLTLLCVHVETVPVYKYVFYRVCHVTVSKTNENHVSFRILNHKVRVIRLYFNCLICWYSRYLICDQPKNFR